MAEDTQTVTILLRQFNHMCDELLELREYKKNSINIIEKIRAEINTMPCGITSLREIYINRDKVFNILDKYKEESEDAE